MCPLQKKACPSQKEACPSAGPPQQILHLIADLDGYGLTRQLELLVAEQLAEGKSVRIVALRASREGLAMLHPLGVDCRVLTRRWRFDPLTALRLRQELRRQPTDFIHIWGQTAADYFHAIQLHAVQRWAGPTLAATPTLITLPENLTSPGILIPPPSKLTRQQFLDELQLPSDSILIAVAGPLTRSQQIDEAIWHYELLRTLDERLRLLIFGDGPDRHRVERFARLTSEPHSIRFLGYRTDFRELLPHSDLFWHTGMAHAGLPLTLLEAMAASVPVIANHGPGSEKIIDDNVNGYLIAGNDRALFARQTRKILLDKTHAEQLASTGLQTVEKRFSEALTRQAFTDAYAELLKQH